MDLYVVIDRENIDYSKKFVDQVEKCYQITSKKSKIGLKIFDLCYLTWIFIAEKIFNFEISIHGSGDLVDSYTPPSKNLQSKNPQNRLRQRRYARRMSTIGDIMNFRNPQESNVGLGSIQIHALIKLPKTCYTMQKIEKLGFLQIYTLLKTSKMAFNINGLSHSSSKYPKNKKEQNSFSNFLKNFDLMDDTQQSRLSMIKILSEFFNFPFGCPTVKDNWSKIIQNPKLNFSQYVKPQHLFKHVVIATDTRNVFLKDKALFEFDYDRVWKAMPTEKILLSSKILDLMSGKGRTGGYTFSFENLSRIFHGFYWGRHQDD